LAEDTVILDIVHSPYCASKAEAQPQLQGAVELQPLLKWTLNTLPTALPLLYTYNGSWHTLNKRFENYIVEACASDLLKNSDIN
jgi:hypothetical protein